MAETGIELPHKICCIKSAVGEDILRRQLYSLRFGIGDQMEKYIVKFEYIVTEISNVGGKLDPREEMKIFRSSLPDEFTGCIEWLERQPAKEQTLEALKLKVLERNRKFLADRNGNGFVSMAQHKGNGNQSNGKQRVNDKGWNNCGKFSRFSSGSNNNNNSNVFPNVKCWKCGQKGHFLKKCDSVSKEKTNQQDNASHNDVCVSKAIKS